MGSWRLGYASAVTVSAVGVSQLGTPETVRVGIALICAACLIGLASSITVRAWLAEHIGRLRSSWWWKRVSRANRRRGYAGVAFVDIVGVPPPGSRAAKVSLERLQVTTHGKGERWIDFQTQPRALHFIRPVNRNIDAGEFPYELLSWLGRFTVVRIMPRGLLIDDHMIANVIIEFEILPMEAITLAARQSPRRTKGAPSPPAPSPESRDRE